MVLIARRYGREGLPTELVPDAVPVTGAFLLTELPES
jgi:hypothetical protein